MAKSVKKPQSILGYGVELKVKPEKIMIVDTNVPLMDSESTDWLQGEQKNVVIQPMITIKEIDDLKHRKPELASQISAVVKDMNQRLHSGDPYFYVAQGDISNYADLDPSNPDHHVIATYLTIHEQYPDIPITLISNDGPMHVFALALGVNIEEYQANREDTGVFEHPLPHLPATDFSPGQDGTRIIADGYELAVPQNGGVVLDNAGVKYACIRKGNILMPIRQNISILGMKPYTLRDGETNWEMYLALEQLLDPTINLLSLIGVAGTGKTMLAIAAGMKLVHQGVYDNVAVSRPLIRTSDRKDGLGFVKGDLEKKIERWLKPIYQNLDFLSKQSAGNRQIISSIRNSNRFEILSLDEARGYTLNNSFLVVDEAQNCTPDDIELIGSRVGADSKMVFTGDLEQIDLYPQDKRVCALSHFVIDFMDEDIVGNTYLVHPARSKAAELVVSKSRKKNKRVH